MKRIELWQLDDEPAPLRIDGLLNRPLKLRDERRARELSAHDDWVVLGFLYGLAAAALCWAILSGALLRAMLWVVISVHGLVWGQPL